MSDPAPLQLVVGDEPFLVTRAIDEAVAAVQAAYPQAEVKRLGVTALQPGELTDLISPSLFAEERAIVLSGAQEAGKDTVAAILDYATAPTEGIVLIVGHSGAGRAKLLADGLRKAGATVVECPRITRYEERLSFVKNEVRRSGGRITTEAVAALVDAVGSDLMELSAAATQLATDTEGTVDETAVARYHRGRADVTGFVVAEKVMTGDRTAALEALGWAINLGVPHVVVADALADAVRTVARVRSSGGGDPYRLASTLGMPPWKVKKAMAQSRGWEDDGLAQAIQLVADVNADVKGVAADAGYALERAVLALCDARRR